MQKGAENKWKSGFSELKKLSDKNHILEFPNFGTIVRCTDRGFGFFEGPEGEEWFHISDKQGKFLKTIEGLEGQKCIFVKGGAPFGFKHNKPEWVRSVVKWQFAHEIDADLNDQNFEHRRNEALLAADSSTIDSLLFAQWYLDLWQKKAAKKPKSILFPDAAFEQALRKELAAAKNLQALVHRLLSIVQSPWFAIDKQKSKQVFDQFFEPKDWSPALFHENSSYRSIHGFSELDAISDFAISKHIFQLNTVAIDLESNGTTVYQYGWENYLGSDYKSVKSGFSEGALSKAVKESLGESKAPVIVGHNLINWDLPILAAHHVSLPETSHLWDTLLASWLLEPWRKSHALIVEENAHRADADAAACRALFEAQQKRFAPVLEDFDVDIQSLIDRLFEDPDKLSDVSGRAYPSLSIDDWEDLNIISKSRRKQIAWKSGGALQFVTTNARLNDPELIPDICFKIAKESEELLAKLISIIVADAARNNVQVYLSMLPAWLVNSDIEQSLRVAHQGITQPNSQEDSSLDRVFHLAEDLCHLDENELERLLTHDGVYIVDPENLSVVLQRTRQRVLKAQDVQTKFPEVAERAVGRAMYPVITESQTSEWLLFEPPGINTNQPSWFLIKGIPKCLQARLNAGKREGSRCEKARLPRWRDGELQRLDVDRIFVLPDSANRALYLSDLTHCVLNLLKHQSKDKLLVLGLRWVEEAKKLQQDLELLGVTHDHPGSALRRLESLLNKKAQVLVCAQDELPNYVNAAERLNAKICIAIDEVPLLNWYAMLNTPLTPTDGSRRNSDSNALVDNGNVIFQHQATLSDTQAKRLLLLFLDTWLDELIGNQTCLVLDARLVEARFARSQDFKHKDVPFFALHELLDEDRLRIFNEVCHPERLERDLPNDYVSYQAFLKKHWGFEDFRPGTQQPAIRKLIDTDRDMLIRLPTGAGKSVIFHLPSLFRSFYSKRLTVVITPLRALMRDQAEGLWSKGFSESVDYLSGGRDAWINRSVYQGVLDGRLRLIFVAPERFRVPQFTDVLERRRRMDGGLEFVVFDEAHCISEWGFEFRPDYLYAARYVAQWFKQKKLPGNPHRLLLTSATVTQRNRTDLEKELGLGREEVYEDLPEDMPHPIQPFIVLESWECDEDETAPTDEKLERISQILKSLDLTKSAAVIFVPRRRDCHRLSDWLNALADKTDSGNSNIQSMPFHAGLPESVKEEAIEQLRQRQINVLVCTKAFGMGMDIPHLHACIHLRPPTYIEDYLQEVGRIGRGESERIESGHEQVMATLLYNNQNIERNLGFVQEEAIQPPDLIDFFNYCLDHSMTIEATNTSLCIVPDKVRLDNAVDYSETKVSKCLFWLERMHVLKVEGHIRSDLQLTVTLDLLREFSSGKDQVSRVATSLLQMLELGLRINKRLSDRNPSDAQSQESSTHLLGRLVKGILKGIVALTSPPPKEESASLPEVHFTPGSDEDEVDARVSMRDLISDSGVSGIDDLFHALIALSDAGALTIRKTFEITQPFVTSSELIWDLIDMAASRLLESTGDSLEILSKKALEAPLSDWYQKRLIGLHPELKQKIDLTGWPLKLERQISREVYRATSTALRLLGNLRIEIQQQLSGEREINYVRAISNRMSAQARSEAKHIQNLMKDLHKLVLGEPPDQSTENLRSSISLTEIIESFEGNIGVKQIEHLMTLLERSGLYRFDGAIEEGGTLISISRNQPLERHDSESQKDSHIQTVYKDVLEKNDLQELRASAMVLLTIMPPEDRKDYIDKYFNCMTADDITELLENTVGNVDEQMLASNQVFQELLSQVRKERFSEEIERLNDNQLAVCRSPFDVNLLVNAGPGSGKTHVLMMRCAHLIHVQKVDPAQILVLAFNRAVVYEIRDRIRTLFRALGYGNYANKLDVTTFHSFALRFQQSSDQFQEEAIGEAVHRFAHNISTDSSFAREVAGKYRTVLVDEFQDMNQDFYNVVTSLFENCKGGGMVIGDDDQDILTWNRRIWMRQYGQSCPMAATYYFEDFLENLEPNEFELTLNYRSLPEIVKQSIRVIETVSNNIGFPRMKSDIRLNASRIETGLVQRQYDPTETAKIAKEALGRGDTVGVLCRSNRECQQVYQQLISGGIPAEEVNLLGTEDFPLYQLRHSGALLDICRSMNDYEFVEEFVWAEMSDQFLDKGLADSDTGSDYLHILRSLIREEVGRPRIRDFTSFLQETRASDVERMKAKLEEVEVKARLTLATIHKVKGLQFDTVLVAPSDENFPFRDSFGQIPEPDMDDCAEEARLFYVGLTRARNRLYFGWRNRERGWYEGSRVLGTDDARRSFLKGSPKEIFVSWAGRTPQVSNGVQEYIESQVRLGDRIALVGKDLHHNGCTVGKLSNATVQSLKAGGGQLNLRVSNVIRYTCGRYFREHQPGFWEPLSNKIKSQGWFYVVLPEEVA